jgi:glycosyltransferase involved in cell wall biosynthesis
VDIAPDLVTVVVPAYNAQSTLDETLWSVRAQTHANLEILVVDDGSIDATASIAERHAADDKRIKVIRQPNQGVAAARNKGLDLARAEYVAPVDADDLWHATKIQKQLALMKERGARVGLVYCWSAHIDERSRIIGRRHTPTFEGNVFGHLCRLNLVGNGSAALMRAEAMRRAGGYDPELRRKSAQGSEDIKLYLQIALGYEFAVVPEYLTGYRRVSGNMSADWQQMYRSFELVAASFEAEDPLTREGLNAGRNNLLRTLFIRAVKEFQFATALGIYRALLKRDRYYAINLLARVPAAIARNFLESVTGKRFNLKADDTLM